MPTKLLYKLLFLFIIGYNLCHTSNAQTVTLTSQEKLWVDANNCNNAGPQGAWMSFTINNTTGATLNNVEVTFNNFTGSNASWFVSPKDSVRVFSSIPANQKVPVYYYVDYSEVCNHSQGGGSPYSGFTANYGLKVNSNGNPIVTRSSAIQTEDLITANSAGIATACSLSTSSIYIGQSFNEFVTYSYGNNSDLFMQPNSEKAFEESKLRLIGSEVTNQTGNVTNILGTKDSLWYPSASVPGGGGTITVKYTWLCLGLNNAVTIHPWAAAKSGNKYKYEGMGSATIIPAAVSGINISKVADPDYMNTPTSDVGFGAGISQWKIALTNTTNKDLLVCKVYDSIPSCMTLSTPLTVASDITNSMSAYVPSVGTSGFVHWDGIQSNNSSIYEYLIPANTTYYLIYRTNNSACSYPANYINDAYYSIGSYFSNSVKDTLTISCVAPDISYSASSFCQTGTALVSLSGNAGGTYNSSPSGLSLNSSTGTINLAASSSGTYWVKYTVTAHSCTSSDSFQVSILSKPNISISSTNILCRGNATGSATASASGSVAPYSYSWNTSPIQTTSTISSLIAGSYTVTVTDGNGCQNNSTTNITQPSASLGASIGSQTNVLCFGNNTGSATINVSGGTAPFQYKLDAGSYQSSATFSSLTAGSYNITIKDANNCTTSQNVTISQPSAALSASIGSQTNVLCFGNNTGSVTINVSGGTAPYQYKLDAGSYQSSATFSSLTAGSYIVTIKDANNCTTSQNVTISQPSAALNASIGSQTNVLCFGNNTGSVTLNVSGGTAPYQYKLDAGSYQSSATFSSLTAGSYIVTIKDANNCTTTQNLSISQPSAALSATIGSQTNILCLGSSSGSVTINASGGTSPYLYKLGSGAYQSSPTFSGLAANSYVITIKDTNNCTTTQNVTISQPLSPISSSLVSQTNVLCYGSNTGSIDISASGGTSPYSYVWTKNGAAFAPITQDLSNLVAATYAVVISDANNCTTNRSVVISQPSILQNVITSKTEIACYGNTNGAVNITISGGVSPYGYLWTKQGSSFNSTNEDLSSLSPGTYYLKVTDNNNCNLFDTVVFIEPATLVHNIDSIKGLACSYLPTGYIEISVNGGSSPYTYNWTKMGDISYSQHTQDIYSLGEGTYTGIITDSHGCKDTVIASLNSGIVNADFTAVQVDCDGNYQLTNNSTGADNYVWDINGSVNNGLNRSVYCTASDTVFVYSFKPGSYTITLTARSNEGCVDSMTVVLNIKPKPIAVFSFTKNACTGKVDFTNLTVHGVSAIWNFGDPSSGINNTSTVYNPQHTYTSNGYYTVTLVATDSAGCSDTISRVIYVQPIGSSPTASFNTNIQTSLCVTKAYFTNTSTNAVSYNWSFSDSSFTNNVNTSKSYPLAGFYQVILTAVSASGCVDTISQIVNISSNSSGALAKFAVEDTLQCLKDNSFNFINQSLYYGPNWVSNYYWDFGDSTYNNTNTFVYGKKYANAGVYNVRLIATSPGGCKDTAYQTLRVLPSSDPTFIMTIGCSQTAKLEHNIDSNATYLWDFGDGSFSTTNSDSFSHTFANPGFYKICLNTYLPNGCTDQYCIGTLASDGRDPIPDFTYFIACGNNIQFKNLSQWGSSFLWDFGDGSPIDSTFEPYHSYPYAGTFNVTLTVYNSPTCIKSITYPVTAPKGLGVKLPRAHMAFRVQPCTNVILASDSNSVDATLFHWYLDNVYQGTANNIAINTSGPGFYKLTMIADNGDCSDTIDAGIEVQDLPHANFTIADNSCNNTVMVTSTSTHALTYDWIFGDPGSASNISHGSVASHTYDADGTYDIRLIAYNLNGCADTTIQTVHMNHLNSYVQANFWYDGGICNCRCQNAVKFNNTTPGTGNVYLWSFGDGTTSVQTSPTKGFPSAGNYSVTLTSVDNGGCISSKTFNVHIDSSAYGSSAAFSTDHQVQCIDNNSFNFYNNSTYMGLSWVNKYYWYFGDGTMDSTNSFIFGKHYSSAGNYIVTLVAVSADSCRDTSSMFIQVRDLPCTGVLKYVNLNDGTNWHIGMNNGVRNPTYVKDLQKNSFSLFPNPNDGNFKINLSEDLVNQPINIKIFDIQGRELFQKDISNHIGEINLDVSSFESGQYIIQITNLDSYRYQARFNKY